MRKLLLFALMAALLYSVAYAAQHEAAPGCCCDPIIHNGSIVEDGSIDCPSNYNFTTELPEGVGESCDDICEAELAPVINITPPLSCESSAYKPSPGNVAVKAVKGKKQLRITYTIPCPGQAYAITISRCTGDDCDDFKQIAKVSPTGFFTDTSTNLLWKTDYTYKLVITSRFSGESEPAIANGNPGDIECWSRGNEKFCLSQFSYNRFQQYLELNGYLDTTPDVFSADFPTGVDATFDDKYGKAFWCSEINLLTPIPPGTACPSGQQCIVDDDQVMCIKPSVCGNDGLFGLYPTLQGCEGTDPKKYCFLDRSATSIDKCYSCNPQMACADYRSQPACARDNCHAGNCSWHEVFPDIGTGVCVDSRFPNCPWCKLIGTEGLENNEAYNEVFDQCTGKKSSALTVGDFLCVFDKNSQESNACDAAACMDYNKTECGSPDGGIMLNPDNSLETSSTDPCDIKVCQYQNVTGCFKNADGDILSDCELLGIGRRQCELDYFAPNTSLVPVSYKPERMDWLLIRMLDRRNGTDDGELMEGKPGYNLRVCVVSEETPCTDAKTFSLTNKSMLNFNDLYLQGGRDVLATMEPGTNTLRYYGVDASKNPEIVKEIEILACNKCQGPKLLELSVNPSRLIDNKYYTIAEIPVITASLNEPSTLTSAMLTSGSRAIPVTANPGSGANYDYTFIPVTTLTDGEYLLTFNAKDSNGLLMDVPGSAVIVVDTTPGDVTILPPDGTVINETSVDISFIFGEPATIKSAVMENEIWISKYAAKKETINLVPWLSGSDDARTFTTTLTELYGGKKNLKVEGEDLAGNPSIGKSSFWINQGLLQMRMREPSWGVSASYKFDIVIDTSVAARCQYLYNTPAPFPVSAFDEALAVFPEESEVVHKISGFDKIATGDLKPHKFHVYCKAGDNITVETFDLRVDTTPPVIKSAYADPKIIVERRIPNADIFTTYLKAQTDDEGFCRYSTENVPFVLMKGVFSGFDEIPKRSHDAEVNVTQDNTSYTYYVACKNTAQSPSATVPVQFSVDTSIPFSVTSMTPPYSNSTELTLRLESNKRAFCYIGETIETAINLMGEYGHAHTYPVEVNGSGNFSWFVKCSTGAGNEVADVVINVVVDTTPPEMRYVDDNSTLAEEPEFSYFLDQLRVSFLGFDSETAVNAYYYRLLTFLANDTVLNWTLSTNTNGTPFFVSGLNLTDGNKYRFEVYPVNIVGLQGGAMLSDGVTIDVEKAPTQCENGVQDGAETDLDCGGECAGCNDGAKCAADTDCVSGFCNGGVCSVVSCDDNAKNGAETDVDCGGTTCLPCADGRACVNNTDCSSGSCNFGMCGPMDPCSDGVLTGTETDIDCGGSCSVKCLAGKNCQMSDDCAEGLVCIESTCQGGERDSDRDGVSDDRDKCPNTPSDEAADSEGCSPSQKFSCGDAISDGWRIRYFGSVLCDGEGAPDADPDNDGLTNLEEYKYGTDPKNPDTDYDGWTDKEEVDAGTNPLDSSSHPASKTRILLWILLILLILGVLAFGGYMGYQYYQEKRLEALPPSVAAKAPEIVEKKYRRWPEIIEKLRKIARKEEPGVIDKDWVSLAELSERLKTEKVPVKDEVFGRLKGILSGKISKKEMEKVMSEIREEPSAFKLLRKISFEKLTPAEKELFKKKLAFLKAGNLTSAELEQILTKLRITAAYYKAHKEELDNELEEWLSESRRAKK